MKIEILTICDHAQEIGGKMFIIGTFDSISSQQFPAIHPTCSVAARFRFTNKELGSHKFLISIVDSYKVNILPPIEGALEIKSPDNSEFISVPFILNLNSIKFDRPGSYTIEYRIDGQIIGTIPLKLVNID